MSNLTITIEAPALVAALDKLAQALIGGAMAASSQAAADEAVVHAAPAVVAPTAAVEVEPVVAAPAAVAEGKDAAPASVAGCTVEQVREALGELAKAKGKAVAKGILTQIGVKSVSDLQPEQLAVAMALIKEAQ